MFDADIAYPLLDAIAAGFIHRVVVIDVILYLLAAQRAEMYLTHRGVNQGRIYP